MAQTSPRRRALEGSLAGDSLEKGKTWQLREREQFGRRLTQSVRVDPRPFQSSNGLEIRHVEW